LTFRFQPRRQRGFQDTPFFFLFFPFPLLFADVVDCLSWAWVWGFGNFTAHDGSLFKGFFFDLLPSSLVPRLSRAKYLSISKIRAKQKESTTDSFPPRKREKRKGKGKGKKGKSISSPSMSQTISCDSFLRLLFNVNAWEVVGRDLHNIVKALSFEELQTTSQASFSSKFDTLVNLLNRSASRAEPAFTKEELSRAFQKWIVCLLFPREVWKHHQSTWLAFQKQHILRFYGRSTASPTKSSPLSAREQETSRYKTGLIAFLNKWKQISTVSASGTGGPSFLLSPKRPMHWNAWHVEISLPLIEFILKERHNLFPAIPWFRYPGETPVPWDLSIHEDLSSTVHNTYPLFTSLEPSFPSAERRGGASFFRLPCFFLSRTAHRPRPFAYQTAVDIANRVYAWERRDRKKKRDNTVPEVVCVSFHSPSPFLGFEENPSMSLPTNLPFALPGTLIWDLETPVEQQRASHSKGDERHPISSPSWASPDFYIHDLFPAHIPTIPPLPLYDPSFWKRKREREEREARKAQDQQRIPPVLTPKGPPGVQTERYGTDEFLPCSWECHIKTEPGTCVKVEEDPYFSDEIKRRSLSKKRFNKIAPASFVVDVADIFAPYQTVRTGLNKDVVFAHFVSVLHPWLLFFAHLRSVVWACGILLFQWTSFRRKGKKNARTSLI